MTNRNRYIQQRDAYDLLKTLWYNTYCPIEAIGAPRPDCPPDTDGIHSDCEKCMQKWLNEEERR